MDVAAHDGWTAGIDEIESAMNSSLPSPNPYLTAFRAAVKAERQAASARAGSEDQSTFPRNSPQCAAKQAAARRKRLTKLETQAAQLKALREAHRLATTNLTARRRKLIRNVVWERAIHSVKEVQDFLQYEHDIVVNEKTIRRDFAVENIFKDLENEVGRYIVDVYNINVIPSILK